MTDIVEPGARYLLVKRGLYYRPDNNGYTGVKEYAGRYLETDAAPDCGVSAIHEDKAPMFSQACWHDVKVDYLLAMIAEHEAKLTQSATIIAQLRADNARLRIELANMANSINIVGSHYDQAIQAMDSLIRDVKSRSRAALQEATDGR